MPYLVDRVGPQGYVPSGEPQAMRGMIPQTEWLRALMAALMARQAPPVPPPPPPRPEALRGIDGMLRPRGEPYLEQYPYPRSFPPRG